MDRLLRESGVDFEKVNYYIEPLTKKKLAELLGKMNISARELLRTSEQISPKSNCRMTSLST